MPQSWMPQSAEAWMPSSAEPINTSTPKSKGWLDIAGDFINEHPSIRRFFAGPSLEDIHESDPRITGIQGPDLMKIPGVETVKSHISHKLLGSGNNLGLGAAALAEGIGGFLEGGFDPRTAGIKPVPRIDPTKVEAAGIATKSARNALGLDKPNRLALPAKGESFTPPRTFISGEKGLADTSKTYPLDLGIPANWPERLGDPTVLPRESGEVNQIPADLAANQGLSIGEIPRLRTDGSLQELMGDLESSTKGPQQVPQPAKKVKLDNRGKGGPLSISDQVVPYSSTPGSDTFIGDIQLNSEARPFGSTREADGSWNTKRISNERGIETPNDTSKLTNTASSNKSTDIAKNNPYRAIPDDASVKDAVSQWAYGQQGANVRGDIIRNQFKDLLEDPSLVDKYESGDRTGRLADVAKWFEAKLEQGRAAGIFKKNQTVPNYLRHEFEQSPEEVTAAVKKYIARNPSIAKTRRFPTYAEAEASGLTRKNKTIPEIMESYQQKFSRAIRNKEFYDWLNKTGRLEPGDYAKSPDNWTFKGEDAEELKTLIGNVMGSSPKALNKVANATSFLKNLYLGSGIPKTPLNMHMYNITRSDIMARGLKNGLGDFFSGVFKPAKDAATIEKHSNSGMLSALVDHGMGWTNIEDHSALLARKGKVGNTIDKITDLQQKIFEDPLFKTHLPAVKLRFASERVQELTKRGLDINSALTQAATEANDFYGGINKILRNKTYSDLARSGLLAPDWLESRANLAGKGMLSLVGKANPLYGKALARGAGMRLVGAAATMALTGKFLNDSKRSTNSSDIPLGKTETGLNRNVPVYGSAVEGLKIPEELASGRDLGNVITSRISQPARAIAHIVGNEDSFGNPLRGTDKYGRPIPWGRGRFNEAKEVANTLAPPWLVAIQQLLSGKDPESAIGTGLELPVKYNTEPNNKNKLKFR